MSSTVEDLEESFSNTNLSEIDDAILDAQDAYFDGNLEKVISSCEKVLKLSPKEIEAYDLLSLALFQSSPPQYTRALEVASEWGGRCGDRPKQLFRVLKCAYHIDDIQKATEAANKLFKQREELLNNALAAALIADMGNAEIAKKLAGSCAADQEEFAEEDLYGLLKMSMLLAWVDMKTSDKGEQLIRDLLAEPAEKHEIPAGLAYSLLIVHKLETDQLSEALSLIQQATESQLEQEEDVIAARALAIVYEKKSVTPEAVSLAKLSYSQTNPLLKKRLEKKVLL